VYREATTRLSGIGMASRHTPNAHCTHLITNMTRRHTVKVLSPQGWAFSCPTLKDTGSGDERFEIKANLSKVFPATRCLKL